MIRQSVNTKKSRLFIGLLVGGIVFCILVILYSISFPGKSPASHSGNNTASPVIEDWPSSMDAMIAAPASHRLLFENAEFRIMEVFLGPGQTEPVHTHRGRTLAWIVQASQMVRTAYSKNSGNKWVAVKKDTLNFSVDELNKANWEDADPPHSMQNVGVDTFKQYRIEYKD